MASTQKSSSSSEESTLRLPASLYIERRIMTAIELSEQSAGGRGCSWFIPAVGDPAREINLCQEGRVYKPLAEAPPQPLAIARQLEDILEGVWLPASESDTKGRAFVITNINIGSDEVMSLEDSKIRDICLDALGISNEARPHATFRRRDWDEERNRHGFCYTDEDFEEEDLQLDNPDSDRSKVIRATQVMSDELQGGFEFNFDERVICGPVLYGGFVGQNIVGILSMRVWT